MRQLPSISHHATKARRRLQGGYVLLITAIALTAIMGICALAVDLGRMYIAKSESQAYVDAASLSAAAQLDGTSAGIAAAQAAAQNGVNKWNLNNDTFSGVTVSFAKGTSSSSSTTDDTTWTTTPPSPPTDYRFVKVAVTPQVPLSFIRAFSSSYGSTAAVAASATAAQVMVTTYMDGLLPFSPITPVSTDTTNYGFQKGGTLYTLRYPSVGSTKKDDVCGGDQGQSYTQNLPSQDRGFWGSNSASAIRGEIVDDQQVQPLTIGDPVPMVGGGKTTEGDALNVRVLEDTDSTSTTYSDYLSNGKGNGRRVIGVPVNSGAPDFIAIGVRAFFLQPAGVYDQVTGSDAICAEYIGTYVQGGGTHTSAGSGSGGYLVRLTQ